MLIERLRGFASAVGDRLDALSVRISAVEALPSGGGGATDWSAITGKPTLFPPSAHLHVIGDVAGLQAALDGKANVGAGGGSLDWADITGKPATFAPSAHTHVIADVTGLQGALDGKQPAGAYLTANQSITLSGDASGSGTTAIAVTIANASGSAKGLMSAADFTKLSGMATGATVNSADATLLARANHTGSQSLDTTTDSATRLAMTAAERTKLTGVAAGATANATDASLRDRSTHTGTQAAGTITGLATVATSGSAADLTGALAAARLPALTGDVTTAPGTVATTLTTVNASPGSFGSSAAIPVITVDGKGRITAVSTAANSGGSDPWLWSKLAANVANSTVTLATSGLSFTAAANTTYLVQLIGTFQSAATTTGIAVALDIPSGSVSGQSYHPISATTAGGNEQIADNATTGATTAVRAANTNVPIGAEWIVAVGATGGPVVLMFRSEIAASAVTLQANLTALGARVI